MLHKSRLQVLEERLAGIEEISRQVAALQDLDDLLTRLLDTLTVLLRADRSSLFLVDPAKDDLYSVIVQGEGAVTLRLPIGQGLIGEVARTGRTINVADAYCDSRFYPEVDRATGYRTRSVLTMPLRNKFGRQSGVIGVVQVLNRLDGRPFDDDDTSLLETLASQMAIAIENSRLYGNLLRRTRELDALYEIEREIGGAGLPLEVIERVLAKVMDLIGTEAGALLLHQGEGKNRLLVRTGGALGNVLTETAIEGHRSLIGWTAAHGQSVLINDFQADPRFDPGALLPAGIVPRQALATPLEIDGRIIGAVELTNRTKAGGFDENDERLLNLVGRQIARAVRRAEVAQQQEQQARLAAVGRMLAGVLHDFKTPMTVINNSAEILVQEESAVQRRRFADYILHQVRLFKQMTADLMGFVRGERRILARKIDFGPFLDEVRGIVVHEAEGLPVEVTWQPDYEGAAFFDPDAVRRALLNLIRNAFQALPDGGLVNIAAFAEDEALVFRVADNGPGIPEQIRSRLFETFISFGKKEGTGLGLAIVKQVVEDHSGAVDVETATGRGTTFTIRLPLQPGAVVKPALPESSGTDRAGTAAG